MQVRRTKAEWDELVAAYRESGQTMRAFCESQGINVKTLGNYARAPEIMDHEPRSMEEWLSLISEQKGSGQSLAGWCREHKIQEAAMRAALRRQKTSQATHSQWVELTSGPVLTTTVQQQNEKSEKPKASITSQTVVAAKREERPERESGKIRIRSCGLEMEVDAGYPVEKLAVLLERLVK